MRIVFKIINSNTIVDNYDYSLEAFYHNDRLINFKDRLTKLVHLIGLTSKWKETIQDNISNGFYIFVEGSNYNKEYFFSTNIEENFLVFVNEIKMVAMEGK